MLHLVGFYITLNTLMMHGQTQIKFDGVFKTKKMNTICQLKASKLISSFLLNGISSQMTANLGV